MGTVAAKPRKKKLKNHEIDKKSRLMKHKSMKNKEFYYLKKTAS